MPEAPPNGPGPKLPPLQPAKPAPAYVFGRPWWAELLAGGLFATGAYFALKLMRGIDPNPDNKSITE